MMGTSVRHRLLTQRLKHKNTRYNEACVFLCMDGVVYLKGCIQLSGSTSVAMNDFQRSWLWFDRGRRSLFGGKLFLHRGDLRRFRSERFNVNLSAICNWRHHEQRSRRRTNCTQTHTCQKTSSPRIPLSSRNNTDIVTGVTRKAGKRTRSHCTRTQDVQRETCYLGNRYRFE